MDSELVFKAHRPMFETHDAEITAVPSVPTYSSYSTNFEFYRSFLEFHDLFKLALELVIRDSSIGKRSKGPRVE